MAHSTDKVESKYIKNHTISYGKKESLKEKLLPEKDLSKPQSKYIKNYKETKEARKLSIHHPYVCYGIAVSAYVIYILANSGFGSSLGFPTLNFLLALALPIIMYFSRDDIYLSKGLKKAYFALLLFSGSIFISYTKTLLYENLLRWVLMISPCITAIYIGYRLKNIKYISFSYVIIAMVFAFDYAAGGITVGWNGNSIAILVLFGVVWLSFISDPKQRAMLIFEIAVFAIAFVQTVATDCRSVIASLVVFALLLYVFPKLLEKSKVFFRAVYIVALSFPCIVALVMNLLYTASFAQDLNAWVLEKTGKLFFSGREDIWQAAFEAVSDPIFGNGHGYFTYNTHNMFLTIYYNIGFLGYILLCLFFAFIFEYLHKYFHDYIVRGSFISFISVYIMHAFENIMVQTGIMSISVYFILAVGIGRASILEKEQKLKISEEKHV